MRELNPNKINLQLIILTLKLQRFNTVLWQTWIEHASWQWKCQSLPINLLSLLTIMRIELIYLLWRSNILTIRLYGHLLLYWGFEPHSFRLQNGCFTNSAYTTIGLYYVIKSLLTNSTFSVLWANPILSKIGIEPIFNAYEADVLTIILFRLFNGQLLRIELRYRVPQTLVIPFNYNYLIKWERTESNSRSNECAKVTI